MCLSVRKAPPADKRLLPIIAMVSEICTEPHLCFVNQSTAYIATMFELPILCSGLAGCKDSSCESSSQDCKI